MEEENGNSSIVKRETGALARIGKSLEVTKKLLALNDDPFLIPYRKGDKWGFCDRNKKIVIPCIYDRTYPFIECYARALKDGKVIYINKKGTELNYEKIYEFSEGLARVRHNRLTGFIDSNGKEIISCEYKNYENDSSCIFSEGLALVIKGYDKFSNIDQYQYIDKKNNIIIPYEFAGRYTYGDGKFSEGLAVFVEHTPAEYSGRYHEDWFTYGYTDKTGKVIIPPIYSGANPFSEGLAAVRKKGKWGFIDKNGNEIIPFIFEGRFEEEGSFTYKNYLFTEGIARVKINGKWGYIDKKGTQIIPCIYEYDEIGGVLNGFIEVKVNNKYGYFDKSGNKIIPCIYDESWGFDEEGLNAVGIFFENKWNHFTACNGAYRFGFINKKNNEAISFIYDQAYSFKECLAPVCFEHLWGYINNKGHSIIHYKYDAASIFENGLAEVHTSHGDGFIDKNGNEFWED